MKMNAKTRRNNSKKLRQAGSKVIAFELELIAQAHALAHEYEYETDMHN